MITGRPLPSMNCATSLTIGTCRCTLRACNNLSRIKRAATVGSRLSPTTAHELAGPAQQTSTTLSMYCNWRISLGIGPRESASAPRRGCQRPAQLECPQTARCTESEAPSLCANPTSLHGYRDVHNRRNCTCDTSMRLSSQQRACHHLVQELQLRNSTSCTVWTRTPPRNPAATTPPHPVGPSALSPKLKNSQPVPPPQSQNLTQGGEHLRLAEVEKVGGLDDSATVVYDSAALDDVTILTSIALYNVLADS